MTALHTAHSDSVICVCLSAVRLCYFPCIPFHLCFEFLAKVKLHLLTVLLKRRMAIANGTCVSFCNQPKAHYLALTRVTPVCRCLYPFGGCRHLATLRESKAHFGLPWVRPLDNRGKCYMDRKRIQCLSNASRHVPIYLQPFTSYRSENSLTIG